ncbi:hypothetical protein FACS1894193_13090 [Bacilli bacterium]|nr:hypothetical protein FACS1894192_00350 [Bacilli bacterium]GHU44543.1 hypothetical protein FACS1894193_13090 [Bacilli bacterium]
MAKLVEPKLIYLDGTHIKAHANHNKFVNQKVEVETLTYQESLEKEIDEVRVKSEEKSSKIIKYQRQLLIVAGFIRENTKKFLHIQLKLLVLLTVGY